MLTGIVPESMARTLIPRTQTHDDMKTPGADHLLPEESPFREYPVLARYLVKAAEILFGAAEAKRADLASAICLPSFEPEWAVRLIGSEKVPYSLLLVEAEQQIWGSQATSVAVRRAEVPFPATLARVMDSVWKTALGNVRHPDVMRVGLDGTSYHFTRRDPTRGPLAGRTWSPPAEPPR
jgi:hypothetical protein